MTKIIPIKVADSNIVLLLSPKLEVARAELYGHLLNKYGTYKRAGPFDYSKYEELDPMERCFDNAMATAKKYCLTYVEGILIFKTEVGPEFPLAHGWCEDADGNIVDSTCAKNQDHPSVRYYGVPIKTSYSEEWYERVGYYGCLDGDYSGKAIGVHYEPYETWGSSNAKEE
jgi:hypothetical protein